MDTQEIVLTVLSSLCLPFYSSFCGGMFAHSAVPSHALSKEKSVQHRADPEIRGVDMDTGGVVLPSSL